MDPIFTFVSSLVLKASYEVAKAAYKEIWGKDIINRVFDAYESAIEKWDPDNQTGTDAKDTFEEKIALLRDKMLMSEDTFGTDADTYDLLELFKNELLNDKIAYNWLNELHWETMQTQLNRIEKQISNLSSPSKPHQIIPSNFDIFLIDNIKPNPYHIPRNLTIAVTADDETQNIATDLVSLIQHKTKIVVLACAGMGKSEELKQTATLLAEQKIKIPIFISLRDYTGDKDIEFYLPTQWEQVSSNHLAILMDGMDELLPSDIAIFKRKLDLFCRTYCDVSVIVSSRSNFYDIASANTPGSLIDFKEYILQPLTSGDIIEYVERHHQLQGQVFINAIYHNQFDDLVYNPFFLPVLISNYKKHDNQFVGNRIDLLQEFIEERIIWDRFHFQSIIELKDKKLYAIKLLCKIAFAIQLLGQRKIGINNLQQLILQDEFEFLKFCPIIKKEEGSEDWIFEHNNFQELLCAQYIMELPFNKVLDLISYLDYAKVKPSWVNTISFLISLLKDDDELFQPLIDWIVTNDPEILVKVEKERLSPELRYAIFTGIFNHYKALNIWIKSSNMTYYDLACFGQSNQSIDFTLSEIMNTTNNRRVRMNGLYLFKSFSHKNDSDVEKKKEKLLLLLENENLDPDFIYDVINAIKSLDHIDIELLNKLMDLFGQNHNQHIRAAIYSLLNESAFIDQFNAYYIEGLGILRGFILRQKDRENITFMSEEHTLYEGLAKFKEYNSLSHLIDFYIQHFSRLDSDRSFREIYSTVINNCINCFKHDASIYLSILLLLTEQCRYWRTKKITATKEFFLKTNTTEKAISYYINGLSGQDSKENNILPICELLTESNMDLLIEAYKSGSLTQEGLNAIAITLSRVNVDYSIRSKDKIFKECNIQLDNPKIVDYGTISKIRTQRSFDLLFNWEQYKEECLRIFEEKDSMTSDELWNSDIYMSWENESYYPESALSFLQDLTSSKDQIQKSKVENLFKHQDQLIGYRIQKIYSYLSSYKEELSVTEDQLAFIKNWYDEKITTIDFTKALYDIKDGSTFINSKASQLVFFMQKFNFACPDETKLDMLCFAHSDDVLNFTDIASSLPKNMVDNRIVHHIKDHIVKYDTIYYKHAEYIFRNHLLEAYSTIFDDLVYNRIDRYRKESIIDLYFEHNVDLSPIKELFSQFDFETKIACLNWLITRGDIRFALDTLLTLQPYINNKQDQKTVNNLLIRCSCLQGLENSIRWIDEYKESPFSQSGQSLVYFDDIEALPYFMQLVGRDYDKKIQTEHSLDRMLPLVLDGIQHLALASKENFDAVCQSLQAFIQAKSGVLDEVEFLNATIERIKERFFQNYTPTYKIKDVKRMIKEFADYQ